MAKIPAFGNIRLGGSNATLPDSISIGPGLGKLGDGLNAIANLMLQKKQEDDQLQYQKALLDLDEFANDELNNPETGYLNLKGENALNEAGNVNQRYTDKIAEIRETLRGNSYLNKFDLQTQDMHIAYNRQLMMHESREQDALAANTIQSSINLAMSNAESLYNDNTSLRMGFDNLLSRIDEFSHERGVPNEVRQQQREQITQQYYSSALDGWVAHTEITKGSFSALAANMKKSMAYNQLTEINKAKYMLKLDGLIKRQGNENRDTLKLDLSNAWAMQVRGITAPDIPLSRFNSVYGKDGKREYDSYQDKQTLARNISAMQNMPTDDLIPFTKEEILPDGENTTGLTADPNNSNFAERLNLQSYRAKAATLVLQRRNDDPIMAAHQAGEIDNLDFSEESLRKRITQATRISQDYKTPLRVFSNAESKQLSNMISDAGYTQQSELLQMLANVSGSDNNAYQAMLNDVGLENPVFAVAGNILNSKAGDSVEIKKNWFTSNDRMNRQATADLILKGAEALKGTGKGDSKIKGLSLPPTSMQEFDKLAGSMFVDDAIAKQTIYSAVMSYYVGKSISQGNYANTREIDPDLLEESINAVAGETSRKYNVRMPWGMDEDTFSNHIEQQYDAIAVKNGWVESETLKKYLHDPHDPYRLTRRQLIDRFRLVPSNTNGLPDGRYFLKAGNGFLRDNNGLPVIINTLQPYREIESIPE